MNIKTLDIKCRLINRKSAFIQLDSKFTFKNASKKDLALGLEFRNLSMIYIIL